MTLSTQTYSEITHTHTHTPGWITSSELSLSLTITHTHTTPPTHDHISPSTSIPAALTALHVQAAAVTLPEGEDESLGQLAQVL